jgi:hypothetical protein
LTQEILYKGAIRTDWSIHRPKRTVRIIKDQEVRQGYAGQRGLSRSYRFNRKIRIILQRYRINRKDVIMAIFPVFLRLLH